MTKKIIYNEEQRVISVDDNDSKSCGSDCPYLKLEGGTARCSMLIKELTQSETNFYENTTLRHPQCLAMS